MKKELEKNFEPSLREDAIYKKWCDKKYFKGEVDKTKKPYTIVMPPPNITGTLHMGHALDNTIQDILIRTKKMQGYNTLWAPGTDHASISTEVKIVNQMKEEGITKDDIGREEFLNRAWKWKDKYGNEIVEQLKRLGSSCDWDKQRFTMDSLSNDAVSQVFLNLYKKGYIYKGEKLINWCPKCQTTISDAEVEHIDCNDFIWHMKYKLKDSDEYITFATTRPETLLGDTAVAVNPKDARYKHLIGKKVIVPIVDREIHIIADDYVEIEFGTGAVKITPAHDINDFEIGERHNLQVINIFNNDGTLNEEAKKYEGLDRLVVRKKIIEEFKELGLFVKEEPIKHAVATHERCAERIEPLIKMQWFVKMEEMAKPAIKAYKNNELNFIPDRFGKIYLHWLENIKDWCISRQLWWGHRIPAYYCQKCNHIEVASKKPNACSKCSSQNLVQDEDTLDTWFSSALWPFSTMGWPQNTEEFEYFYPTSTLVTGYDIIFFWVVRMVFSAIEQTGKLPFKDVVIHGLVRDEQGRKMSKSLGNGINPLDIIDKFGTDALRLTLIAGNSAGNDLRFNYEKVEANRNFLNKIWNATKFMLMHTEDNVIVKDIDNLTMSDKWIISKVNTLAKEVTNHIDTYDLSVAVQKIYDFIWDEYCDWYIEMVKPRLYNKDDITRDSAIFTLKEVLIKALKLLHPFMPFITEEIFTSIQDTEESIMISKWVNFEEKYNFEKEEKAINEIKDAIKAIRNIRADMNVKPSQKTKITLVSENEETRNNFENEKLIFNSLAHASAFEVMPSKQKNLDDEVSIVIADGTIYMPFSDLVDIEKEIERLESEKKKLIEEVERINKKLDNKGFVEKAPQKIIDAENEKMEKYKTMLKKVEQQLTTFDKK
jgi:valyl-tRNA synthetase